MATSGFESIDEFIATQPPTLQPVLQQIRAAINAAIPDAVEGISYQLPTWKLPGVSTGVLHLGVWKKHLSLYPASERVVDSCEEELRGAVVDKGTIKLPLTEVPLALVTAVAKVRAAEVRESAALKAVAKKAAAKKTATTKR